jgi:hypothetical protein
VSGTHAPASQYFPRGHSPLVHAVHCPPNERPLLHTMCSALQSLSEEQDVRQTRLAQTLPAPQSAAAVHWTHTRFVESQMVLPSILEAQSRLLLHADSGLHSLSTHSCAAAH